jgi:glycosyltransferase involved in cell wall biosynthesis
VGGIPEVVVAGLTGLLAKSGDDGALAEAVLKLLLDHELADRLGQAGRQRAMQMFSEEEMHERYARLYRSMLAGSVRAATAA